jgi:hypothetical protein
MLFGGGPYLKATLLGNEVLLKKGQNARLLIVKMLLDKTIPTEASFYFIISKLCERQREILYSNNYNIAHTSHQID